MTFLAKAVAVGGKNFSCQPFKSSVAIALAEGKKTSASAIRNSTFGRPVPGKVYFGTILQSLELTFLSN